MLSRQKVMLARLIDQEYVRLADRDAYLVSLRDVTHVVLEGDDQADSVRKIDEELALISSKLADLRAISDELFPTVFDLEEVA